MKRYFLFLLPLYILASMVSALVVPSADVRADVSYSCPAGQTKGSTGYGQDIRYCYTNGCPAGQAPGDGFTTGSNVRKCYEKVDDGNQVVGPRYEARGDVGNREKRDFLKVDNGDDQKCPEGLWRGGIQGDQDSSKCYTCTPGGCQESGQSTVHKSVDACNNSNQQCIERQRREHEQYIQSIRDGAPAGFTVPGPNDTISGSRNAQLFCNYYKAPEETRIDTNYVYRACIIGYEVGYGRGNICSELYLFGANATHKDFPNSHAKRFRAYVNTLDNETKKLLISQSIAACEDGWNQYRVDYWYCNGNQGCQRALRQDASRVIDPGPAPTREVINGSNSPTPAGIVFQTGTPTQTCGSIQTAYFSCGGGGNDIQTSSFWQILQLILNILIGMVAIAAVGGLVFGAVKYSSAGDNASQVSDAKNIIKNVIIGLVLFLSMWAIIQYFIPGGIL